jgi:hypothetical protein
MRIDEIEQDLKVIRRAMEVSSRYTNIPEWGYLCSGLTALLGTWCTYRFLGAAKVTSMALIAFADLQGLVVIWGMVFVVSLGSVMFFSWHKARKNGIRAWNSLASRMLFSQVPLIVVTGILSIAMALKGYYPLIPGIWLAIYGSILYSFSYYTGISHKIEALAFIVLGVIALFADGLVGLGLLGIGFGGIHIVSGLTRWLRRGTGQHEPQPTE